MASPYRQSRYPDPPDNLPPAVAAYLRDLVARLHQGEASIAQAFQAAEPAASLQVLGVAPDRSQNGDEVEVDATLGAAAPFGSGAGKYVMRAGSWVFIG